MNRSLLAKLRLLELVVQAFLLGDLEGRSQTLIVGAETHQAADDCLIGAVALAGARK